MSGLDSTHRKNMYKYRVNIIKAILLLKEVGYKL
jgi:hypothetical protein